MHIEYQITEADFVAAAKLAMRSRSKRAVYWMYALRGWGALLIAFALISALLQRAFSSAVAPLVFGSLLLCLPTLWTYQFRRQYRKMPLLQESRSLDLNNVGLRFFSATSDGHNAWQSYTKFAENNQTFILFQQGNQIFIPIPKSQLSPGEINELRSVFEAHLPRK